MNIDNSVLIVDDSRLNREYIGGFFQNKGINLRYATNGKEALSEVEKEAPDLILLDVIMPEIDGYTVCEILKKNESTMHIPIIFLTSMNETKDLLKGFAIGAVDYVNKPFKQEELVSRVVTHLELKKSRDLIEEQKKQLHLKNLSIMEHSKIVEQLNEQMKSQNIILQEVIDTKDKFFSIISHDLKGPLGNIISFTDLIITGYYSFSQEKLLSIIRKLKEATISSTKLLENLLQWARSQTGTLTINPVKLEICHLIREIISSIKDKAILKGIQLEIPIEEEFFVYADESMLTTILRNLISNAIKFTPTGGTISVLVTPNLNDASYIQVEVNDTGIGIDESTIDTLFAIDKNRSKPGTNGEKGSGLGLVLCKEFVEKNNGKLTVKSKLGKGSSFRFTLPSVNEV